MQKYRGNPGKLRTATIRAERLGRRKRAGTQRAFTVDPVTRRFVRPVLIASISTALAAGLLVIVTIGTPENRWGWLVPFLFLVSLVAAYSAAWLSNPQSRTVDKTLYRVSEVVVIIALARLISWLLFTDVLPSLDELRLYLQEPLRFFLAGGFLTTALIALAAWWFSASLSTLFWQLDVSEEELRYYTLGATTQKAMADDQPIQVARQDLQDAYLRLFLAGGIILVILAALSTFEVNEFATVANPLAIARLGLAPGMLAALLVYFLVGIWLLSHARLLRLNARWLMDGVAMDATFERSWQRISLFWLALIALIAAFLPIGDTLPISRMLGLLVNGVFYLMNLLVSFVSYLFGSMLIAIQNAVTEEAPPPTTPFVPPAYTPPAETAAASPLIGAIFSSAFWALMIALVIGAVLFVARERGYNTGWDRVQTTAKRTKSWLAALWAAFLGKWRRMSQTIPVRLRGLRPELDRDRQPPTKRPRRFLRLNGLSPREQIMYFYLSTVKRAGERGVARRASETPSEYAADLKEHWPDTEMEVEELTSAFIEARYSPAEIPPEAATTLKSRWKRLREQLRRPADRPPDESNSS